LVLCVFFSFGKIYINIADMLQEVEATTQHQKSNVGAS